MGTAHFKEEIKAVVQTYVVEYDINIIPRRNYLSISTFTINLD